MEYVGHVLRGSSGLSHLKRKAEREREREREREKRGKHKRGESETESGRGREEGRKTGEILVGCSTNMDEGYL